MTKTLAKGLCHIADSLPRVEFLTLLYPTRRMKQAVADLYAYIIRFLIRAQGWYQEGKVLHALHSFTRPAELRYVDLIDEIEACTRTVDSLASAGAQAEQRDVHVKLQALIDRQGALEVLVREMYEKLISKPTFRVIRTMLTAHQSVSICQFKRSPRHKSATFRPSALADHGCDIKCWKPRCNPKSQICCSRSIQTYVVGICETSATRLLAGRETYFLEIITGLFAYNNTRYTLQSFRGSELLRKEHLPSPESYDASGLRIQEDGVTPSRKFFSCGPNQGPHISGDANQYRYLPRQQSRTKLREISDC